MNTFPMGFVDNGIHGLNTSFGCLYNTVGPIQWSGWIKYTNGLAAQTLHLAKFCFSNIKKKERNNVDVKL